MFSGGGNRPAAKSEFPGTGDAATFSSLRMRAATEGLRKAAVAAGTTSPSVGFSLGSSGQSQEGTPKNIGWPFGKQSQAQADRSRPPAASFCDPDVDISQQVAEWDNEMDHLDRKESQVRGDQWKVLRVQMASLMGAVADIRTELLDIKENAVMKSCWPDVERVIENMVNAHDEHGKKEDVLSQRVTYLEEFIGESLEKQSVSKGNYDQHKTTMETRLEYLEGLVGDSADKHSKELEDAQKRMEDLHKAVALCAKSEYHNSLEQRMEYLEKFLGESADKYDRLAVHNKSYAETSAATDTRLEYLEALVGDSADKHAKEIAAATDRMVDLHQAIQGCATHGHHANLEERLVYLEGFTGESADKHQQELESVKNRHQEHKTTMETRLEFVESLLGDSADKHSAELDAAKTQLGDLHLAISACSKAEHQVDLGHRVDYIEKFLGESADKEAKQDAEGKHIEHLTTVETRLEYLESFIGDSADKHSKEISAAQSTLGDLHKAVEQCARTEHHTNLEVRVESLEKQQADHWGTMEDLKLRGLNGGKQIDTSDLTNETFQRAMKSIWEALDTHTHDVDVGVLQRVQQPQPQPTVQVRQVIRGASPGPTRVGLPTVTMMPAPMALQVPPGSAMNMPLTPGAPMNMQMPSMSVPKITPPGSPLNPNRGSFRTAMQPPGGYTVMGRSISPAPCAVRCASIAAPVARLPPPGSSVTAVPGAPIMGATTPSPETDFGTSTASQPRTPTLATRQLAIHASR